MRLCDPCIATLYTVVCPFITSLPTVSQASFGGDSSLRTRARYTTASPTWYETLSIPITLPHNATTKAPLLHIAPQLHIELWDENTVLQDKFMAEMRINLASDDVICTDVHNMPPELPIPHWYLLTRLDTGHTNKLVEAATARHGELLLNVQLIRKSAPNESVPCVPASIMPPLIDYYVDFLLLGCRSLASADLFPIEGPSVGLDFGGRLVRPGTLGASDAAKGSKVTTIITTSVSRKPSTADPNYCTRLIVPVRVPRRPKDVIFAPTINVSAVDNRLGGAWPVTLGTGVVALEEKVGVLAQ
jgi:hypothetical protein